MKVAAKYVSACLVISLFASTALAAEGPCANDVQTLCKDVQPGGGKVLGCLKQHEAEVSPACKAHLAKVKQQVKEVAKACQDDVLQLCPDVKKGGGRIAKCLKQHQDELTPECKEKIMETKKQMQH